MATPTPATPELPTLEEIELATYKLGSFMSDLDGIASVVERLSKGDITTIEEYREREARGDLPGDKPLDRERLTRLVVFACEALEDAEAIAVYAKRVNAHARCLLREQDTPEEVRAVKSLVDSWHASELQRRPPRGEAANG